MSVVKINAIEIPEGAGPDLESSFAKRAGAVENSPGFEGFQLLRPTEGESRYFVMTWWADEESFEGWMKSRDAAKAHAASKGETPRKPVATGTNLMSFEVVEHVPGPRA